MQAALWSSTSAVSVFTAAKRVSRQEGKSWLAMQASTLASTSSVPDDGGAGTGNGSAGGASGQNDREGSKRPRVLFMGPRSSGKSSIRKVVFERMAPSDTLFIEKSSKNFAEDINSFISLDIWDLPGGQLDPSQIKLSFSDLSAVIFVLDAQSTFQDMISKLVMTMEKAFKANRSIQFEIFLHKIDGMSEDYRLDTLQHLRDRLTEEMYDISPEMESNMNVFYHLTSVFDTSIYEALSKVIQKLIPEQGTLERLLDLLCQQCAMDKAFLFDTSSKIYIATDSSTLDTQVYVICSDYLDLVGDFTSLYEPSTSFPPQSSSAATSQTHSRSSTGGSKTSHTHPVSALSPSTPASAPTTTTSTTPADSNVGSSPVSQSPAPSVKKSKRRLPNSKVKLGTGATIAQWAINSNLSLVALVRPNTMEQHSALIDYNVSTFRDAVLRIFELELQAESSSSS